MRKIIPVLFAIAATTAAGTCFADAPVNAAPAPSTTARAQRHQHMFDKIDTNHDGLISRAEYQVWLDSRFAKLDTNGDGVVSAQEIEAAPATAARVQERAERFVKRYDTSGSGNVTKADFEAKEMGRFDKLSGGADTLTEEQLGARGHGRRQAADAGGSGG